MTTHERHEPTISELIDLLSRLRSVFDEQTDDNGERFRESNGEMYAQFVALESYIRDCSMTAGEVTFRR